MKQTKTVRRPLIFAMLAGFILHTGTASAEVTRGEMLANACAGCHGTMGISNGPASPTIAGISKDYFIETMNAYRDEFRPSTIMSRIAKGYSDEDIAAMAKYFAAQPFKGAAQSVDAAKAAEGKKLHDKYCEKCHAEGGASTKNNAGILKGQWKPYLKHNMRDFISGNREAPQAMATAIEDLHKTHGDAGVEAIIEYYSAN